MVIPYTNSQDIEKAFYTEAPFNDLENTIYKQTIEAVIGTRLSEKLLYLRASIQTEASLRLSRLIEKSSIPVIVDDPNEVRIQTLSWYAEKVRYSSAVIAHFLSETHSGSELHNAKNSFVSGLAYGMGKSILMLAHEPYRSPIDYRDFLKTHDTAAKCESFARKWLKDVEEAYRNTTVVGKEFEQRRKAYSELQNISLGESVAEYENENLKEYFVRTAAYDEALTSKQTLFIGRKGSGKTAILIKLADDIDSDRRNHVCVIKPVGYEAIGIVAMVEQSLQKAEKGYLIESFWKFLIYTELAKSIYESIQSRPTHYQRDKIEEELIQFVENNNSIILPDFSIRLEAAVNRLQKIGGSQSAAQQRIKISELLHEHIIAKLRASLGQTLEKKHKTTILIDNLDKAWNPKEDIIVLCDLLRGLIEVSQRITADFGKSSSLVKSVNLSIIIFLRSDIFEQVLRHAIERDKLSFSRICWSDSEMLIKILEERFMASTEIAAPQDIWSRYFCPNVIGIPTREYITRYILPKPRDLIYLSKTALANAINRRHTIIEEQDILDAQKGYSQYALDSLDAENAVQLQSLLNLLYEFVGANDIIDQNFIIEAMEKCHIHEHQLQDVIDLLCDLTFLGREVEPGLFVFQQNEQDKFKLQTMARRVFERTTDKIQKFKINEPFHSYLEIKYKN